MDTAIIVALITALGGVLAAVVSRQTRISEAARLENREDHAVVQSQLKMIFHSVTRLDDKVEKHLEQHGEGQNGKIPRRNT